MTTVPITTAAQPTAAPSQFPFHRPHILGMGGCGMSALAWAFHACGLTVSGTDIAASPVTSRLASAGMRVHIGHDPGNIGSADALIVSTAIREDNPELLEARRLGLPVLHRSEALALFLERRKPILVSGTHGKTTTTAMTGIVLEAARLDPWVFVGGSVPAFDGNTRVGGLEWAVAEADESDGTFERLPARHLIVTNIEEDHLDYWGNGERMRAGYRRVIEAVHPEGSILCCLDDSGANAIRRSCARPIRTYGTMAGEGDYSGGVVELGATHSRFDFYVGTRHAGRFDLGVPGIHNVANAVAALGLLCELGGDPNLAREALARFGGVGRRFEIKGEVEGVLVVDDYGHHPTEIRATLRAALTLARARGGRLAVLFQPHRYTRTRDLMEEFAAAFADADLVYLTEVHPAGEDPIPGATGEALAERVARRVSVPCCYVARREDIAAAAAFDLRPRDVALTLGAGSITRSGPELLTLLPDPHSPRGTRP